MATLEQLFIGNPVWNRPTHGSTGRCVVLGGSSCCICVPSTATRVVVEMWGQGGGGSAARCCSWGCTGGQGGSYAYKVWEGSSAPASTGQCMLFCGCVCACDCKSLCSQNGHPGQFARLCNCNSSVAAPIGSWVGCVNGGAGGQRGQLSNSWVCFNCGCDFNRGYNICCIKSPGAAVPEYYSICCLSTAQNSACDGGSMSCCAGSACYCATGLCSATCTGTKHIYTTSTGVRTSSASSQLTFDEIFVPVNCTCFDSYRRGACGWTCASASLGYNSTWNYCDVGVGGASYAGGMQENRSFNNGNFAYCGYAGNLPGGGGRSSGACGGPCCCGSIGGQGLILVSWDV